MQLILITSESAIIRTKQNKTKQGNWHISRISITYNKNRIPSMSRMNHPHESTLWRVHVVSHPPPLHPCRPRQKAMRTPKEGMLEYYVPKMITNQDKTRIMSSIKDHILVVVRKTQVCIIIVLTPYLCQSMSTVCVTHPDLHQLLFIRESMNGAQTCAFSQLTLSGLTNCDEVPFLLSVLQHNGWYHSYSMMGSLSCSDPVDKD